MKRLSTTVVRASNKKLIKWRDAASLIILSPQAKKSCKNQNFEVLMLKRHAEASFYPNSYVFPGGGIDEADRSLNWMKMFNLIDRDFTTNFENFFIKQDPATRSPLFPGVFNNNELPNEISFRICAIRESFEESGVLILTDTPNNLSHKVIDLLHETEIVKWQELVHKNAENFLRLCQHLNMVPDIWCLHEWSNWLTPSFAGFFFKKRFDTVFYTCCLDKQPYTAHDEKETTIAVWDTPISVLNSYHNLKIIQLGPPQIYELRRLLTFPTYRKFTDFVIARKDEGMRRWLPILAESADGNVMSIYPGDDLYPAEDEIVTDEGYCIRIKCDQIYSKILQENNLNHFHYVKVPSKSLKIHCTSSEFGHVIPDNSPIPVIKPRM